MGGQAYLTRLAFGRSAYEPVRPDEALDQSNTTVTEEPGDHGYVQDYDEKGHPKNLEVTARIEAQIAAKNEVLAAVGVCERKNSEARQSKLTLSDAEWRRIQDSENNIGELGRLVAECVRLAGCWWLVALRERIQVGIINSNESFLRILSHEWHVITTAGFVGAFSHLTAGAVPELTGQTFSVLLEYLIEELHIKACEIPFRFHLRRTKRQKVLRWIDGIKVGALIGGQLLLSPFAISAALQQLGLVASQPVSDLLPWSPLYPLRWAWCERADALPLGSRLLSTLLSPASLWCISNTLYQILSLNYGSTPFCPEHLIIGPEDDLHSSSLIEHWPLQKLLVHLKPLARFRNTVLRAVGWLQEPHPTHMPHADAAIESRKPRIHRQTELSRFPSRFLAMRLNSIVYQLIFLPLDSLFLRTLVSSFVAGPLATRGVQYYPPGAGPLAALMAGDRGPADWKSAGAYVNKVGLCLALGFSLDTAIWTGVYTWTKHMGVTRFRWGEV